MTGAPRPRRPLLAHSPALDGLRGLAILLVAGFHFAEYHGPLPGGWAGVDVFFVLSGFLITALLLDEARLHGRVALRLFWLRRALRLLPALLLMVTVWTGALVAFHGTGWFGAVPAGGPHAGPVDVGGGLRDVALALGYGLNWVLATGHKTAPIHHLWSLAVEEQFYLLWPLCLLVLLRAPLRHRAALAGALAGVSAVLPLLLYRGGAGAERIYFGTDTRALGLLLGAAAALAWHRRRSRGLSPLPLAGARSWFGMAAVSGVAVLCHSLALKALVAPPLLAVAVVQVVPRLLDAPGSRLARLLSARALGWVGRRSYGLYLWHYLWATWTHPLSPWLGVPLGLAATAGCAEVSWRWVERPALRAAGRFRPARAGAASPSPTVRSGLLRPGGPGGTAAGAEELAQAG